MPYRTVIQMRNRDSFITQAMLSSYLSVGGQYYVKAV